MYTMVLIYKQMYLHHSNQTNRLKLAQNTLQLLQQDLHGQVGLPQSSSDLKLRSCNSVDHE